MSNFADPENHDFDPCDPFFDEVKELTDIQIYNLIPECPLCGNMQGAENIKICAKHQTELLNKLN